MNGSGFSVSDSARQICQWLQSRSESVSIQELPLQFLLPIYGMLNGRKVYDLLKKNKSPFQETLTREAKTIQEIIAKHIPYLLKKGELQLLSESVYANRSMLTDISFPDCMLFDMKRIVRLSANPLPHSFCSNLHQIEGISDVLDDIFKKQKWALDIILKWFGSSPVERQSISCVECVELQMILLRYEMVPGMSYAAGIQAWVESQRLLHGFDCTASTLFARWETIALFPGLLENKSSLVKEIKEERVSFTNTNELILSESDTFGSYITRYSQEWFLHSFKNIVEKYVDCSGFESFKELFCQLFAPQFADVRFRPKLLCFIDAISKAHLLLQALSCNRETLLPKCKEFLKDQFTLLQRLFFVENSTLSPECNSSFSLLLSLLCYIYTVTVIPEGKRGLFNLHRLGVIFDTFMSNRHFNAWSVQEMSFSNLGSNLGSDLDSLLDRVEDENDQAVIVTKYIMESSGLKSQSHKKTLLEHLAFIQRIERLTGMGICKEVRCNLLLFQPLTNEISQWVDRYEKLKEMLRSYAFQNTAVIPSEALEMLNEWTFRANVFDSIISIKDDSVSNFSIHLRGEIFALLSFSFFIPGFSSDYSRFLTLCFARPCDQESQEYKIWQWAYLHNGALREIRSNCRAIRSTILDENGKRFFSIEWVQSWLCPETRQLRVPLAELERELLQRGDTIEGFISAIQRLCEDTAPSNAISEVAPPVELFSNTLKCGFRALITGSTDPVVTYDATRSSFYIRTQKPISQGVSELSIAKYDVLLNELHADVVAKRDQTSSQCAVMRLERVNGVVFNASISWKCTFEVQRCMGEGDDEIKDVQKEFYRVEFWLSDLPGHSFLVTYETPPTKLVLAWQLAMLKQHYFQRLHSM